VNPTTIARNIYFFGFRHPKVIDHRKHNFEERTQPFRNNNQRSRAGYTNKSTFSWVFMKLPNHTKKWGTRATFNTFKIMNLIKREEILEYEIGQDWRPHMHQQEN
jgi:hypothetical protein